MKKSEVLRRAANLLEEKEWIDKEGVSVGPFNPNTIAWWAIGALNRICGKDDGSGYHMGDNAVIRHDIIKDLKTDVGGTSVSTWNDDPKRSRDVVIELFHNAAAEYEKTGE